MLLICIIELALDAAPAEASKSAGAERRHLTVPCPCGVQLRYPDLPFTLRLPAVRGVLRVRCPRCKSERVVDTRSWA